MSECVVRMEMPGCCDECPMEYDGFMCAAIHKRFYPKKDGRYLEPLIDPAEQRLPDCPILAVLPENHGRLVDADMVEKMLEDAQIISDGYGEYAGYCTEDVDMGIIPTIVPATEGGKE